MIDVVQLNLDEEDKVDDSESDRSRVVRRPKLQQYALCLPCNVPPNVTHTLIITDSLHLVLTSEIHNDHLVFINHCVEARADEPCRNTQMVNIFGRLDLWLSARENYEAERTRCSRHMQNIANVHSHCTKR